MRKREHLWGEWEKRLEADSGATTSIHYSDFYRPYHSWQLSCDLSPSRSPSWRSRMENDMNVNHQLHWRWNNELFSSSLRHHKTICIAHGRFTFLHAMLHWNQNINVIHQNMFDGTVHGRHEWVGTDSQIRGTMTHNHVIYCDSRCSLVGSKDKNGILVSPPSLPSVSEACVLSITNTYKGKSLLSMYPFISSYWKYWRNIFVIQIWYVNAKHGRKTRIPQCPSQFLRLCI